MVTSCNISTGTVPSLVRAGHNSSTIGPQFVSKESNFRDESTKARGENEPEPVYSNEAHNLKNPTKFISVNLYRKNKLNSFPKIQK